MLKIQILSLDFWYIFYKKYLNSYLKSKIAKKINLKPQKLMTVY